jgi:hypothetical protein
LERGKGLRISPVILNKGKCHPCILKSFSENIYENKNAHSSSWMLKMVIICVMFSAKEPGGHETFCQQ